MLEPELSCDGAALAAGSSLERPGSPNTTQPWNHPATVSMSVWAPPVVPRMPQEGNTSEFSALGSQQGAGTGLQQHGQLRGQAAWWPGRQNHWEKQPQARNTAQQVPAWHHHSLPSHQQASSQGQAPPVSGQSQADVPRQETRKLMATQTGPRVHPAYAAAVSTATRTCLVTQPRLDESSGSTPTEVMVDSFPTQLKKTIRVISALLCRLLPLAEDRGAYRQLLSWMLGVVLLDRKDSTELQAIIQESFQSVMEEALESPTMDDESQTDGIRGPPLRPLKILQWNICGLQQKIHLVIEAAVQDEVDVFLLQETLTNSSHQTQPCIPGFLAYLQCLEGTGRGTAIYVRITIPHSISTDPINCGEGMEVQAVTLHLPDGPLMVYNIYRSSRYTLDISEVAALAFPGGSCCGWGCQCPPPNTYFCLSYQCSWEAPCGCAGGGP
ncbi:hypothetical protein OTU49_000164 [Cherax quadricarinatus]|uniref:Endonuclease/exonuclease/phosphatase domain-containing protein n=1 Tax=Cherax quadricarinatus TaxID=27406 RepID=A0AAW0Y1B9_CHEQU